MTTPDLDTLRLLQRGEITVEGLTRAGSNYTFAVTLGLNGQQCTAIYKPQFFSTVEPARYCTGKLAYDAALRVEDVSDLDWMAAAACIADIATSPWIP